MGNQQATAGIKAAWPKGRRLPAMPHFHFAFLRSIPYTAISKFWGVEATVGIVGVISAAKL